MSTRAEKKRAAAKARYWRDPKKYRAESLAYYRKHGRSRRNPASIKAAAKKFSDANPMRHRDPLLRRQYGISLAEYQVMMDEQGGVCAICHQPETRTMKGVVTSLAVDHNHKTKKIRGLLCHACNASIGLLKENPDRMRAAAAYIERQETA